MLLKKINATWQPSENRGLQVGETIDFPAPYEDLVKRGMAVLVDSGGNEIELPNQLLKCPICFASITGLLKFVDHVTEHGNKKTTVVEEKPKVEPLEPVEETEPSTVEEIKEPILSAEEELAKKKTDLKQRRLAALARAREARKAQNG